MAQITVDAAPRLAFRIAAAHEEILPRPRRIRAGRRERQVIVAGVASVGRKARHTGARAGELARFIGATMRSVRHYPVTARSLWMRTIRSQILFTAVQALPFVGTIALIIGMTVIVQAH